MSKVAEALSELPGSRGIMVLFEKQVHLQKEVGPERKRMAVSFGLRDGECVGRGGATLLTVRRCQRGEREQC